MAPGCVACPSRSRYADCVLRTACFLVRVVLSGPCGDPRARGPDVLGSPCAFATQAGPAVARDTGRHHARTCAHRVAYRPIRRRSGLLAVLPRRAPRRCHRLPGPGPGRGPGPGASPVEGGWMSCSSRSLACLLIMVAAIGGPRGRVSWPGLPPATRGNWRGKPRSGKSNRTARQGLGLHPTRCTRTGAKRGGGGTGNTWGRGSGVTRAVTTKGRGGGVYFGQYQQRAGLGGASGWSLEPARMAAHRTK